MYDEYDDEDIENEDCGCLDEFFEVSGEEITFQFPGCESSTLTMDALRMLVSEPVFIDVFSDTEEIAEIWRNLLPEMLRMAEEKLELYKQMGLK
jgi:hypothetical protein